MAHTCNPSIRKAEARSLQVLYKICLQSKFQVRQGYLVRACFKKINQCGARETVFAEDPCFVLNTHITWHTTCSSNFRKLDIFFWLPRALALTYTQRDTHPEAWWKINKNKYKKKGKSTNQTSPFPKEKKRKLSRARASVGTWAWVPAPTWKDQAWLHAFVVLAGIEERRLLRD